MKKIRIMLAALIIACPQIWGQVAVTGVVETAPGSLTFDPAGLIAAIDQVYNGFEQLATTYTTIENQIRQINDAAARVRGIEWDKFSFDGDWDIRNDIYNNNKVIDRYMSQLRQVYNAIYEADIQCGDKRYSLADICGVGQEGTNFLTATKGYLQYFGDNFIGVAEATVGKMDRTQKIALWNKYGISPENYVMIAESTNMLKDKAGKAIARGQESAKKAQQEAHTARTNLIQQGIAATTDDDGNPTAVALLDGQTKMLGVMSEQMGELKNAVDDAAAVVAAGLIAEENAKQAKIESEAKAKQQEKEIDSTVPAGFYKE